MVGAGGAAWGIGGVFKRGDRFHVDGVEAEIVDKGDGEWLGSGWGGSGSDRRYGERRDHAGAGADAERCGAGDLRGMRRGDSAGAAQRGARGADLHRLPVRRRPAPGDDWLQPARE